MAAIIAQASEGAAVPLKDAVPVRISIEQEELRGISRTVAEIHWLLLILVLLYLIFSGARDDAEASAAISAGLFFYAALVVSFRYANFYRRETRWKIAIESCAMIAFITWVLWHTDRLSSPLLNAYLLPVIAAALTLGKLTTLVEIGLIAACYIFLGGTESGGTMKRCSPESSRATRLVTSSLTYGAAASSCMSCGAAANTCSKLSSTSKTCRVRR